MAAVLSCTDVIVAGGRLTMQICKGKSRKDKGCGYHNHAGNQKCGMCGRVLKPVVVEEKQ